MSVGVVSDTHGVLDRRVLGEFEDVTRILHAGDVGDPSVLERLRRVAPVTAVRGNVDRVEFGHDLPVFATVDVAGVRFVVTHIRDRGLSDEDASRMGADVFVFGHTHRAATEERDGLLLLNPGSASRPVSGEPPSVAVVLIQSAQVVGCRIVALT